MLERIKETAAFIQARIENFQPEVGIILGTGLGDFADRIDEKYSIDYKEIPNFPVSTVEEIGRASCRERVYHCV